MSYDEYNVENVQRVALANGDGVKENKPQAVAVVGNDCRFAGPLFSGTVARVFASQGIKVLLAGNDFVSTPMVSLATVQLKADLGVIITASHNPAEYNGFKIKAAYGGPATPSIIDGVESRIPDHVSLELRTLEEYRSEGLIETVDLETLYCEHIEENFDLNAIRESGLGLAYDAMYGAGQNVMRRLFPDIAFLHAANTPGFDGKSTEPIHKNLK